MLVRTKELTEAQARVLSAIRRKVRRGEPPPTYCELVEELGFASTATIRDHLAALERKGFVERHGRQARCIRRTESVVPSDVVPILGDIPAGVPTLTDEYYQGEVPVPASITRSKPAFALVVHGDSMIGAGILDGDLAIIRRQSSAANGDVVAVAVAGEVTLKRFVEREGAFLLVAANAHFKPIPLEGEEVTIFGVMVGLLRGSISALERRTFRQPGSRIEVAP